MDYTVVGSTVDKAHSERITAVADYSKSKGAELISKPGFELGGIRGSIMALTLQADLGKLIDKAKADAR